MKMMKRFAAAALSLLLVPGLAACRVRDLSRLVYL